MGSIGDTFSQTVPAVGASGTGYATSINAVLTELIARVSSSVPFSALSGATLDLNNVPAIDFQYLGLYEQASAPGASPVGRLERYNNNLYWVGLSGAVQITSGNLLAASGIGGIGGDYGGANPALVSFVDAANRYDFWDDFVGVTYAYLRGRGLSIANAAAGTNYALINYGGAGSYTLTLPATLPAANRSVLTVSNAGQLEDNDGTATITNDIVLGGTTKIQQGDRRVHFGPGNFYPSSGVWVEGVGSVQSTTAGTAYFYLEGLEQNWRLKSAKVRVIKQGVGTTTVSLLRLVDGAVGTTIATGTDAVAGTKFITVTAGTPYTTATGDVFVLQVTSGNNNDVVYGIEVTYDVPA